MDATRMMVPELARMEHDERLRRSARAVEVARLTRPAQRPEHRPRARRLSFARPNLQPFERGDEPFLMSPATRTRREHRVLQLPDDRGISPPGAQRPVYLAHAVGGGIHG
jgi:hypothetical protein